MPFQISDPVGKSSASGPAVDDAMQAKVAETQQQVLNDPGMLDMAKSFSTDPAFLALMSDPEAVAALKSGDTEALMRNPYFLALAENPRMKEFAAKMMEKNGK